MIARNNEPTHLVLLDSFKYVKQSLLRMIGYRTGKIILKFPPFCQLNKGVKFNVILHFAANLMELVINVVFEVKLST